jgi:hypothetical protein
MKWILNLIAVVLILAGTIWILQGINILPGSFMTGNRLYAFLGAGLDVVGIGILFFANRRSKKGQGNIR